MSEPTLQREPDIELTVVMPCLNEAETVATCVTKARSFLDRSGVVGEVVVADNGSTDGSRELAASAGARVVVTTARGYGNALMAGIGSARGRFVIMGDADDSYDFTALQRFVDELRNGADLVMGNRFRGGIAPGAMPALHRYFGNPILSALGRKFFGSPVRDFHCGLRGFRRGAVGHLGLQSTGMEFASEMVVKATLAGLKIVEVPTTLAPDGRSRPPHIRSWSDGWRHLRFLLLYSPRWMFLFPGAALMALGLVAGAALTIGPVTVSGVTFDVDTLVAAAAVLVIGFQAVLFGVLTKIYAIEEGFLPPDPRIDRLVRMVTLERGLAIGGLTGLLGISGLLASLAHWHLHHFGQLDPRHSLRVVVPSAVALVMSFQIVFASLFASVLGIRRVRNPADQGAVAVSDGPVSDGPVSDGAREPDRLTLLTVRDEGPAR